MLSFPKQVGYEHFQDSIPNMLCITSIRIWCYKVLLAEVSGRWYYYVCKLDQVNECS